MAEDGAARRELLKDIESYTCGEVPSPIVMLRAPRLEEWEAKVRRRGKEFVLVVSGAVRGHHEYRDGEWISVSAIAWFDRKMGFIRTHNRIYTLGQPSAEV
ncbi:hypothetical protein [Bradyrhizobium australafricanum]|uniref:hypothetical protein n=1 Tax=Bradyrhizobium australafricanum TaxID=2821406 RepID=UPI001CE2C520|nr:hypothetical protein [Bradyrhizobium australafricanum]MCA6098171.1 hypothetical protein [Bradyrhizobium australafricanum]